VWAASIRPYGLWYIGPDHAGRWLAIMRTSIAVAVLLMLGADAGAQTADTTLTLACQGTTTWIGLEDAKPEPISMGIIVNFTQRTVKGFGTPGNLGPGIFDYPVKITAWNEVTVVFRGEEIFFAGTQRHSIRGSIDRVTGDVEATSIATNVKTGKTIIATNYTLKCRPTQRMF
jgi:hypothetical protein